MSLANDIHARLAADTDVTTLTSTQIYVDRVPATATLPYVAITIGPATPEHHMTAAAGLKRRSVQIDIVGATHTSVHNVSEAIRGSLDGFRGTMGSTTVRRCQMDEGVEQYLPPTDASDIGDIQRSLDVTIWHTESVPTFA